VGDHAFCLPNLNRSQGVAYPCFSNYFKFYNSPVYYFSISRVSYLVIRIAKLFINVLVDLGWVGGISAMIACVLTKRAIGTGGDKQLNTDGALDDLMTSRRHCTTFSCRTLSTMRLCCECGMVAVMSVNSGQE
jgi:hypothetical protein